MAPLATFRAHARGRPTCRAPYEEMGGPLTRSRRWHGEPMPGSSPALTCWATSHSRGQPLARRGAAAVEAAIVLPFLITLMLGVWEAGRLVQVSSVLTNAAREGARTASGGTVNGADVTVAMVQQTVRDYLRGAGLPDAAVDGAEIHLINTSGHSWTDPVDAQPGDTFRVTATIPAGEPFDSLKFVLANSVTNVTQLSVTVNWASNNDELLAVDTQLPY